MGCGSSSKVMADPPADKGKADKLSSPTIHKMKNLLLANKSMQDSQQQQHNASTQQTGNQTNARLFNQNSTIDVTESKFLDNNTTITGPTAAAGLQKRTHQLPQTQITNSMPHALNNSTSSFLTNQQTHQGIQSPLKLELSVRRIAASNRESLDMQEILGLKVPTQLQDAQTGGYLPLQNQQSERNNNTNQMTNSLAAGAPPSQVLENNKSLKLANEQSITGNEPTAQQNVERKNRKDGKDGNNRMYQGGGNTEDKTEQYVRIGKKIVQQGDDEEYRFIFEGLKNNSVFYSLNEEQMSEVISQMFMCETKKDQYLFKQGDKASAFFLVRSGKIAIEIDEVEKKELSAGTAVGELALLYSAPRSASIKCKVDCTFWAIDRQTFRKTIEEIVQRDFSANRKFMESVPFFSFLSDEQKDSIASALISVRFKAGDPIVNEGDRADSFYLIKEGKVSIWKNNAMIRNLFQSDSFGEQALYVKSTRAATVKADDEVKLLSLGRDDLTRILGGKIQKIVYANKQRWAYNNNRLLLKLTNIQVEKILMNTKISNYKSGTVLYEAGDYCDTLIAVLDGVVKGETSNEVLADKGTIFGDFYLPLENQNIQFDQKIVIGADAVLSTISFKQFHKCIGGDIHSVIKKNADSHEVKMRRDSERKDYSYIRLEDLLYIRKLGVGQFGSVYLVRRKSTRELFALKSVSKGQIISQNLEKHLLSEKAVLESVQFPFIMSYIRSFKDDQSVYFLLKFINGLELFDVIRDIGLLSTFDSQFYIGSLILSLEYLHSRSILYRDIKPENLMVDSTGYMYLIDMGAAKMLSKSKSAARTFTIIGTPHYMAPEIIKGKGYSFNSDLWSVGVCLYEFMCGVMPYAEDAQDPYEIYEEINTKELKFPQFLKDRKAKLFIEQLLQKQPELRLGGSYAALKTNPWFDTFEWDALYNKTIQAPYIPPTDRLISMELIDVKFKKAKQIIAKIKKDQQKDPLKYNKESAPDPNWDKPF